MEDIKILFGKKIRELRKKHKFTQSNLAEIVNVDDKHISCIESGKNFPSANLISKIAEALNVEIKDLFEFSYLQTPQNLKFEINSMIEKLNDEQLTLAYKYIRTFLLK